MIIVCLKQSKATEKKQFAFERVEKSMKENYLFTIIIGMKITRL